MTQHDTTQRSTTQQITTQNKTRQTLRDHCPAQHSTAAHTQANSRSALSSTKQQNAKESFWCLLRRITCYGLWGYDGCPAFASLDGCRQVASQLGAYHVKVYTKCYPILQKTRKTAFKRAHTHLTRGTTPQRNGQQEINLGVRT